MSWFYAKGVNEDGEEYIDYSKCSQPENSLISVKAEITPECKTAKTQTLEYTFYIDTTGPNSKKPTFSYKTEDWGWGPGVHVHDLRGIGRGLVSGLRHEHHHRI